MKKLFALLIMAAMLLTIAGCGSTEPTITETTPPALPPQTTAPSPAPTPAPTPEVNPGESDIADQPQDEPPAQVSSDDGIAPSNYTGNFDMAGMWMDQWGTILTFGPNGTVGPMLFGFEGGPDGSWMISSRVDENGHYTLQASHLTGGSPIFKVRVISYDEVELHAESGVNFGRSFYHLTRQ